MVLYIILKILRDDILMKVRELIEILLDFPLDSDISIEEEVGDSEDFGILSISHDSEHDDFGYPFYDMTVIHLYDYPTNYSNIFDWDFRGHWVTDRIISGYDEDTDESFKIKFNKNTYKFEKI